MDIIITHKHCPDGWCAAFIAKKRYPEAEIMPLDHGEPVPFDAVRGKDVLVVDFSWPNREDNIELHRIAKSFHIFDHHKTAQERLEGLEFATFDMKRSGAGLAWDYLFGGVTLEVDRTRNKQTRPWYINFVEDRDLWNWALPGSKAVNAYLMSLPQTIEAWSALDTLKIEYAEQIGTGVLRHVDRYVQEAAAEAQFGDWKVPFYDPERPYDFVFYSYSTAIVNAPYLNCSEVGHVLAQKVQVGMTWFERADGQTQFSLRSIGNFDVSRIAKLYGGGGHKNASGFRLPLQDGRELIDRILNRKPKFINCWADDYSIGKKSTISGPQC